MAGPSMLSVKRGARLVTVLNRIAVNTTLDNNEASIRVLEAQLMQTSAEKA